MNFVKVIWGKWLPIGRAIGNFQAQVILTVFYLILFLPLGIFFKFFADPMRLNFKKILSRKTNFQKWEHPKENLEEARKQY